jgi:hypothetical protein
MTEYLQVWRAKVAHAHVDRLLAVRPVAIAEAQRLCPELLRADLVRLGDGTDLKHYAEHGTPSPRKLNGRSRARRGTRRSRARAAAAGSGSSSPPDG